MRAAAFVVEPTGLVAGLVVAAPLLSVRTALDVVLVAVPGVVGVVGAVEVLAFGVVVLDAVAEGAVAGPVVFVRVLSALPASQSYLWSRASAARDEQTSSAFVRR